MGQGGEGRLGGSGGGGELQWQAWGPGNNSNYECIRYYYDEYKLDFTGIYLKRGPGVLAQKNKASLSETQVNTK